MALNSIISGFYDFRTDLVMQRLGHELAMDDNLGDLFVVSLKDGGQPADLTGAAVQAYFIRADGYTVPLEGTINGSAVEVLLAAACYLKPGRCTITIKVSKGDVRHAVYCAEGVVRRTMTDALIDPEGTVPSLDELLAQIATIEDAVARANEAADAAQQFVGLTVNASTLPTGQAATASYADGVLTLGLPRGEKGDTGSASPIKVNGVAGVDDNITLTGENIPVSEEDETTLAEAVAELSTNKIQAVNLLDNGNFLAPVNQRGLSAYGGAGYGIDRWTAIYDETVVTVTDSGLNITGTIEQRIPMNEVGDLSGMFTAALYAADGTVSCTTGMMVDFGNDQLSVRIDTTTGLVHFRIEEAGTYKWAALYMGEYTAETLPPYAPKGVAHETLACQRYYQKIPISRQAVYCSGATTGAAAVMIPMTMRGEPKLVVAEDGSKTGTIRCNGVSAITVRSVTMAQLKGNVLWLDASFASTSSVAGYTGSWNGCEIELMAEL